MSKKKIMLIIIIIIVFLVGIGLLVIKFDKNVSTVLKSRGSLTETNESIIKVNELSSTVQELDKTNTDTFKWYRASRTQILNQLKEYNKKYNDKNIQEIISDEASIPTNLLKLAIMHPEAIPVVAGYKNYKSVSNINIEPYLQKGKVPLFTQFDKQWGYDKYGNSIIALDGCGPTSVAMVASYLTGDKSINPKVVADYSESHGGFSSYGGSTSALMINVAKHFGIIGKQIGIFEVRSALEAGHPVIADVGYGDFTLTGHILVLTGVTSDGEILMNNPDSISDSHKAFYLSQIDNNAQAFYEYTKA